MRCRTGLHPSFAKLVEPDGLYDTIIHDPRPEMTAAILCVGTADTKADELGFVCGILRRHHPNVRLVDV
jgi:hypothetical protein